MSLVEQAVLEHAAVFCIINKDPSSASAADEKITLMIALLTRTGALNREGGASGEALCHQGWWRGKNNQRALRACTTGRQKRYITMDV